MQKKIAAGLCAGLVPALLLAASAPQHTAHAVADRAVAVAMPACSMTNCDAVPGICETIQGYHLPQPAEESLVSVASAKEQMPEVAGTVYASR